jgi:hypothetical protein
VTDIASGENDLGKGWLLTVTRQVHTQPNIHEISQKGQRVFETLPQTLQEEHLGRFIAIEVESVDYFIGDTALEATRQAQDRYPGRIFFLGRMGYPTAYTFKGRR